MGSLFLALIGVFPTVREQRMRIVENDTLVYRGQ
jgi:hypothetical membrane protein